MKARLSRFELRPLFVGNLGWDQGGQDQEVNVAGRRFVLEAIACKQGMVAYRYVAGSRQALPDHPTRQKIGNRVAESVREYVIVYAPPDASAQYWQWAKREPDRPDRAPTYIRQRGQSGEALLRELEQLTQALDRDDDLGCDVERVTKRFYHRFNEERDAFRGFIEGIEETSQRDSYASLMLNRLIFTYFIQKRGFLDGDLDYLRTRLERVPGRHGFYRRFLLPLFHQGLCRPESGRGPELAALLGRVPYLSGGLFEARDLELDGAEIRIPDQAFARLFAFFEAHRWRLDGRPLTDEDEINPDVLGHIFEKYVNQKQMGAYYTKPDITGYIGRNTILPCVLDRARKGCPGAFESGGGIWRLLRDDPDRYFHAAVRHGITYDIWRKRDLEAQRDLPPDIAAGLDDVAQRGQWNQPAPAEFALPSETWREHVARRRRYQEVRAKLAGGEVASIDDLITYNLDIAQFVQDAIAACEGPEPVRAFWTAVNEVTVLDPTCGSGAFLIAALDILEPVYRACLNAMRGFVDDFQRSEPVPRTDTLDDFREVLDRAAGHAGEPYFILKSIVVGNLYGVDLMEEAVEICKMRLVLKLIAQVPSYDRIEPLPDLDFNIRAGNALVGFASLDQVKRVLAADMVGRLAVPDIEQRAEFADRAFRDFREIQTDRAMDARAIADAKAGLRTRLDDLRARLDRCLADQYGIDSDDPEQFPGWSESHRPFHWPVEFHGVMRDGGFDAIVGNPPYLEARQVGYAPRGFESTGDGPIHVMCVERSLGLLHPKGYVSLIVPMALVASRRMKPVQRMLENNRNCWYSNFSWRPGRLFDTVNRALTIFVATSRDGSAATFSTGHLKWNAKTRGFLIFTVAYVACPRERHSFWVPKIGHAIESSILEKLMAIGSGLERFLAKGGHRVYHRTDGGLYWKVFTDFQPTFEVNGTPAHSATCTSFSVAKKRHVGAAIATLSSDVFWWWYTVTSNLRHLNPAVWKNFPVPVAAMNDPEMVRLGARYVADLKKNSTILVRNQKTTGKTETQSFKIQKSKPIINEIDTVLAKHYDFSEEEIDFLINYDIKYRLGLGDGDDRAADGAARLT